MNRISPKTRKNVGKLMLKSSLLALAFCVAALLLLKFLGPIIGLFAGSDSDAALIFGQLRAQTVLPPFFLTLALFVFFYAIRDRVFRRPALKTVITVLFFLLLFVLTLLLTSANGILFGKVLSSLLGYIRNGLFSKL